MRRGISLLMIGLFVAVGSPYAQAQHLPRLPHSTVSLAMPTQGNSTCPTLTTGSNCVRDVPAGSATGLQSAINAATCGDTIVLVAGSNYGGNFTIPATSCPGWIEIVSSSLSRLPSPGNRVGPTNVSNMATISTPNTTSAMLFLPNANHWRLIGIELTTSDSNSGDMISSLARMGYQSDGSTDIRMAAQLPNEIIFDRCYIHGSTISSINHGIIANSQAFAVVDSYCDDIVDSGEDSQCLVAWNGVGPYLYQNNFLEATGENVMFGGADPAITNAVPSDIAIIGNLVAKDTSWRGVVADIKNLLELKNAQRVLIDGNVFEYTWVAEQPTAIVFKSTNQSGGCNWCVVQDITFTHNLITHVSNGIVVSPGDVENGGTIVPSQRILVQNNLLTDVSDANWGSGRSSGRAFQIFSDTRYQSHDLIFDHNTAFDDQIVAELGDSGTISNLQFTNNIADYGLYGIKGAGVAAGMRTFSTYAPGYAYNDVALIDPNDNRNGNTYPAGTTFPASLATVGFTNASGGNPDLGGNFQLTSSSPYYQAGTDGKDIGVWDWKCLNADSVAALAGLFTPSNSCSISKTLAPQPPTGVIVTVQ